MIGMRDIFISLDRSPLSTKIASASVKMDSRFCTPFTVSILAMYFFFDLPFSGPACFMNSFAVRISSLSLQNEI